MNTQPGFEPPDKSWPPRYTGTGFADNVTVPFTNVQLVSTGHVSDFRKGTISLSSEGVIISGQSILKSEILYWILTLPSIICCSWLLLAIIFEFWVRKENILSLNWNDIDGFVVNSKKRRACVIYKMVNSSGIKYFSLVTNLSPQDFEAFSTAAAAFKPSQIPIIENGRFHSSFKNAFGWSFLSAIIVNLAIRMALLALGISASGLFGK